MFLSLVITGFPFAFLLGRRHDGYGVTPAHYGAVGAALYAWYDYLNNPRRVEAGKDAMAGSFIGPEFGNDEIQAYVKKAIVEKLTDQQVRDIEIGKAHIGIGMVHRGKLDKPAPDSVAEHDLVSEVYHIIDGSATLVLGMPAPGSPVCQVMRICVSLARST